MTILDISRVIFLIYFMIGRLRNKMRSICSEFCWEKCACLLRGLKQCHVHSLCPWFLHTSSLQSVALQSDAGSDGAFSNGGNKFSLVSVCLSWTFSDVCGHIPHCASLVKSVGTSYVFLVVSRMPVVRASMCAGNAGSIRQATIVILSAFVFRRSKPSSSSRDVR